MSQRLHLELMSKPRLIALVKDARARIEAAQAETRRQAQVADYWKGYADRLAMKAALAVNRRPDPRDVWEQARYILATLPVDPCASEHFADLDAEVAAARNKHHVDAGRASAARRSSERTAA